MTTDIRMLIAKHITERFEISEFATMKAVNACLEDILISVDDAVELHLSPFLEEACEPVRSAE